MNLPINGTGLFFDDSGGAFKTSIVLIHGFPLSHEMWQHQVEALKSDFRVISYDVRGHGKSEVGDGQYTLELFVDDLIALLDHLRLEKVVLCGLSMGGYIALRAIERNPERCCAMVLCDTKSDADTNEAKLKRAASIKAIKQSGASAYAEEFLKTLFTPRSIESGARVVGEARDLISSNSPTGICGALLALAGRTDTTASLSKIKVPTLILVGEFDKLTPPELSRKMQGLIPNSQLHVITKAAHMSNLENPEEFNAHLFDFLGKLK